MSDTFFHATHAEAYSEVHSDGLTCAQFFGPNHSELAEKFCASCNGYLPEQASSKTRSKRKDEPPAQETL